MQDQITIDGTVYVREDSLTRPDVQIVVIEGRWNIVGHVEHHDDGSLTITKAHVIRYWGTTKGLGELAADGPTSKTKLDVTGVVRVPAHAVLLTIDCDAARWSL